MKFSNTLSLSQENIKVTIYSKLLYYEYSFHNILMEQKLLVKQFVYRSAGSFQLFVFYAYLLQFKRLITVNSASNGASLDHVHGQCLYIDIISFFFFFEKIYRDKRVSFLKRSFYLSDVTWIHYFLEMNRLGLPNTYYALSFPVVE